MPTSEPPKENFPKLLSLISQPARIQVQIMVGVQEPRTLR